MVRKLPAPRVIGCTREEREQHFVGGKSDAEIEPEIAVIRNENILAAVEGHGRAGLHGFVAFACGRERNFSLTVELKSTILERALHEHRVQHGLELLVAQAMPRGGCHRSLHHRESYIVRG